MPSPTPRARTGEHETGRRHGADPWVLGVAPFPGSRPPPSSAGPCWGGTTGADLAPQPLRRLILATDVGPGLELTRLLPDTPTAPLGD
ncbi:hypothetical protein ACFT8V_02675 [Streptomyces griseoincarnatus]|uniref:hypothetical protein n=1 Tax=Streptomyces sp. SMS_SU21 TaxID=2069440 RepID=UPI000C8854AD|nr:hypothetical protein [Streptomyces sp. SMS_SU21]MCA2205011.1 hypothetical protein [Streptomyces sp. SMS_SU21]NEA93181.1 hypothetical protein [Actinospica acidiphila]